MDSATKIQLEWENKYNNLKEYDLLIEDFFSGIVTMFEDENQARLAARIMTQVFLHKRMPLVTLIQMMANNKVSPQEVADTIALMTTKDLVLFYGASNEVVMQYSPEPEIIEAMEHFQFPPPILCEPKPIVNNNDSAYLTIEHDSIILNRNLPDRDKDYCLETINYLNSIKFVLNKKVCKAVSNSWNGVKEPKAGESDEDFRKKVRAFEKYNKNADVLLDMIGDSEFHFAHHDDKRGRKYSQGYYINYQGNDWNKGCVLFANKEFLNED